MHIRILNQVTSPTWAQLCDQVLAKGMATGAVLETTQPHRAHQVGIDSELAALEPRKIGEVILIRVAISRHAHDLGVTVKQVEAEIVRDGSVQKRERIGVVEFLDLVDAAVFTIAQEHRRILAAHIDGEDRSLIAIATHVIRIAGMRKLMLHGHELDLVPGNHQLVEQPL